MLLRHLQVSPRPVSVPAQRRGLSSGGSERGSGHTAVALPGPRAAVPAVVPDWTGPAVGTVTHPGPNCTLEPLLQVPARSGAASSLSPLAGASLVLPRLWQVPRNCLLGPHPHGDLEALVMPRVNGDGVLWLWFTWHWGCGHWDRCPCWGPSRPSFPSSCCGSGTSTFLWSGAGCSEIR